MERLVIKPVRPLEGLLHTRLTSYLSSSFHLSPTIIEPSSPAHLELVDCHSYLHHITPHKKVLANTMPGVVQGPSTLYDKVFAQHIVRWWEEQEFWWCDL